MKKFNWLAAILGLMVWFMIRTTVPHWGFSQVAAGVLGVVVGVATYFFIDDKLPRD